MDTKPDWADAGATAAQLDAMRDSDVARRELEQLLASLEYLSDADRGAEESIRSTLKRARPRDAIQPAVDGGQAESLRWRGRPISRFAAFVSWTTRFCVNKFTPIAAVRQYARPALMLATVFWLTIAGANVPSAMLGELLNGTDGTVLQYGPTRGLPGPRRRCT